MKVIKTIGLTEDARRIREEVFVKEQGFSLEFDETDATASHLVFYEDGCPAAVCRYFPSEHPGEYILGRVAVLPPYRGKHLGKEILETAEQMILADGGTKITLSAQKRVKLFYEKNGYTAQGDEYLDEFCPHIHMSKILCSP